MKLLAILLRRVRLLALGFATYPLALGACDHADEQAADHLRVLGFKTVSCAHEGPGAAMCIADGTRFRCVAQGSSGCGVNTAVACERFYMEMPAP